MKLNDLLRSQDIDPKQVLVLRHRPQEPALNKVLPWLAAEKPEVFNAIQQTQSSKLESAMQSMVGAGYIASFIRHQSGKALFIGLYEIGTSKPLSYEQFWRVPAYRQLKKSYGLKGLPPDRKSVLWFNLVLTDFHAPWKGKLIVNWPPPERSWWRRAHKNEISVHAILEQSALDAVMPKWDALDFTWDELRILPTPWKAKLSEWRGIYFIFDTSDRKGYVGAAYGKSNLLGRWLQYAARGHGGNRLLRKRDPQDFRFTILQRVSPDLDPDKVIELEASWKRRLHTRHPFGLNDN